MMPIHPWRRDKKDVQYVSANDTDISITFKRIREEERIKNAENTDKIQAAEKSN